MNAFVVDCSMAMTWLFADEGTPQSTKLLERLTTDTAVVPSLWYLEIANVLYLAERKRRITLAQSTEFVRELQTLNIERDAEVEEREFAQLMPLCREHELTSYDAAYLELATRRQLPLATLDESLRRAAKKMRVKLIGA